MAITAPIRTGSRFRAGDDSKRARRLESAGDDGRARAVTSLLLVVAAGRANLDRRGVEVAVQRLHDAPDNGRSHRRAEPALLDDRERHVLRILGRVDADEQRRVLLADDLGRPGLAGDRAIEALERVVGGPEGAADHAGEP